jgi:hypothetical protein
MINHDKNVLTYQFDVAYNKQEFLLFNIEYAKDKFYYFDKGYQSHYVVDKRFNKLVWADNLT